MGGGGKAPMGWYPASPFGVCPQNLLAKFYESAPLEIKITPVPLNAWGEVIGTGLKAPGVRRLNAGLPTMG